MPAATPETMLLLAPETVQTLLVMLVNVTGLPDAPPVALTVPVPPTATVGAVPKEIVCAAAPRVEMVKLCVTVVAAL